MTRKDYIAIAQVISECKTWGSITGVRGGEVCAVIDPEKLTRKLADVMEADNPRFDAQKFIDACYA